MSALRLGLLCFAVLGAPLPLLSAGEAPLKVVIIGDSTVATYEASDPKRGWGQVLGDYLPAGTSITNLAIPGASSQTFLQSENWSKALDAQGNFLLVQFGHNDCKLGKHPGAVEADGGFRDNLLRIVAETRAAGMRPVLVTPMHRVKFGEDGRLSHEMDAYADQIRRIAKEQNVPLIDLHAASVGVLESRGLEGSIPLNASPRDRVHFNEKGARIWASIVGADLMQITSLPAR